MPMIWPLDHLLFNKLYTRFDTLFDIVDKKRLLKKDSPPLSSIEKREKRKKRNMCLFGNRNDSLREHGFLV
jgi:hypothetical protein